MDPITSKFLQEFKQSFELEKDNEDEAFEKFVNYCCANKENGMVDVSIDDLGTGEATQGIDGIAIVVNHKLVTNISEIQYQIESVKRLDVRFVFMQSKTSASFDNKLMLNFFDFTKAFFSDATDVFETSEMQNFIELKNYIYDNAEFFVESNPLLVMYYVSTGSWQNDKTLVNLIKRNKKELEQKNIFSKVLFNPCGAAEIQELYRGTKNPISTKFKLEKNIVMFADDESSVMGYSGVIPFSEFRKVIVDDGDALKPVFNDNIRDFLGEKNPVNNQIDESIKRGNKYAFCMLNNGITIISEKINVTGTTVVLTDYQIVNGCQTSHVLYENRDMENIDDLLIPIRIIVTDDDKTKNEITKATNNQTSIKPEQLEALSDFQKDLEIFYSTFTGENCLYYERRTGQYRLNPVPKARIVNIPKQIKAVSAMFLNNPHGVSGNYGAIAKNIGGSIFKATDEKKIYYTSALALYKLESLISNKIIDKMYNKARYHVLMLFRIIVAGEKTPRFNANKMSTYCDELLCVLNNPEECEKYLKKIYQFVCLQETIDFTDRKTFERKETTELLLSKINELKRFFE